MRAIVTVMGVDKPGIIAKTSQLLFQTGINILDINQTIMKEMFTMVMLVDIAGCTVPFDQLSEQLDALGTEMGLEIRLQHEDIFNSMHRI